MLAFLYGILSVHTSIFTEQLSCFRTHVAETLIGYAMQDITKALITLANAARMRPFSNMGALYLMWNRILKDFEISSRREHIFAVKVQTSSLGKISVPLRLKEEVAAELWERSAAVYKVLHYVTYLPRKQLNSLVMNNALYTEHRKRERCAINKLLSQKLPRVFESLSDSIAAAQRVVKLEHPSRAIVELEEQEPVLKSRHYPGKPVSLLIKKKDSVFSRSPVRFHDRCLSNSKVSHARSLISITLLQPNHRRGLLESHARLPLTAATEKPGDM